MGTNYQDAAPVAISGQVGSTVSLYDMLKQAYGDNVNQIQSVFVGQNPVFGSYWNPADPHATQISATGTINFADFKNVQITIGNNINSNIFVTLPENSNWDAMRTLSVTALQQNLDANFPADHVPTAADIVSTAKMFASTEGGVANSNDCHGIASDIAASAGATLDSNTGSTGLTGEPANEAGGFWRIAASGIGGGDAWQSQVEAGDIVRMRVVNGNGSVTEHTVTVTGALNSDPHNPGKIMVVDNSNGVISEHPADLNTIAGSVTIYRLTTDGQYLIDQSTETHNITIQGDNFNDLIKVGSGSDTVQGGAGIDTAVLAGNKADYQIVHNADGSVSVSGHGVTDKLVSVEKIQFNDQTVDLSPTPPAPDPNPAPAPAPVAGSVSINDVQITEGNNGQQVATFTATRTGGNAAFDVNFATADGSATTADGDYVAKSGSLHFAQGAVSQTVSVVINGDTKVEGNENFHVNLSGATNGATISHAQGTGIIVNDDAAPVAGSVSINDVQITEGNNGQQIATFTLTRAGGNAAFDVNFATADGSATTADGDYVAKSGTVHFADGVNTQTVSVVVNGDTKVEGNEDFHVSLSGATNGATISHAQGTGIIVNDDVAPVAGSVSINDVQITEGNNGQQIETFTLTRAGGSAAFDVHFATADGSATTADGDYVAKSGTVHFADGVNTQTVSIVVNGDTKVEGNENFHVNLSDATNGATISHAQGTGNIINDDVAPAPVTHHVANDFNGDGISDVLFENGKGSVAMWEMNGDHIASNTTVGSVGSDWHSIGISDFNGDGKADVLWENSKGQVAEWQMNGDHIASNTTVGSVGTDWHAIGTGDFNGDGKADVLWENGKGQVAEWQMNGDHIASNTTVGSVGTDWHAIATGDFNGDGKADVLWENSKGQVAEWQMNGDHIASNTTVSSVGSDWKVAGTGDFNGDGKTDVLWQNANGKLAEWQMNGDHIASNTTVGNAPGSTVIGTGDYNHDGKADVLLQNASGHVSELQMDGDHVTDNETVGSHSINWHTI
ncbi:Calx-beta domain-containing protein [Bradyrhizobium commune]|uniref:VCBS repeat-containing protein n=1 Tax=Bradyrhizobium commune TaxID=83627 RepID=A0A7S9GZ37_9BRAD|nr:Calx-beta domain-containing protein [Bradyrhizobium commune]QPF90220.1 VCBS repeat-containing protein [Bradyrhizobium commune]